MVFLLQNRRRVEQVLVVVGGGWGWGRFATVGGEKVVGKRGKRINRLQIMHTHVGKCKNDTC
jgi:hypothetical protein